MKRLHPTILVLGATGMLGRIVFAYLQAQHPTSVWGTSRRQDDYFYSFELTCPEKSLLSIEKKIGKIDFIINCIGHLLSNEKDASELNRNEFVILNTLNPIQLDLLATQYDYRFIHISTDAVFSDTSGWVDESQIPSPKGLYAMSKYLGEPISPRSLSIRTSLIGFDPVERKGLLELLRDNSKKVYGFYNQQFSGCTVLQYASLCDSLANEIVFDQVRTNIAVLHFAPISAISKFQLLKLANKAFGFKQHIIRTRSTHTITRSLTTKYPSLLQELLPAESVGEALSNLERLEKSL